jgi:adenylate cyclase
MFRGGLRNIKTEILSKMVIIVAFSLGISISYNYFEGKKAAINNASKSIEKIDSSIIYQTSNFLFSARDTAQNIAALMASDENLDGEDIESIKALVLSTLRQARQVTGIKVALENGFYLSANKVNTKTEQNETSAPEGAVFVTKIGFRIGESIQEKYYNRDFVALDFEPQNSSTANNHPHESDWYKRTFDTQQNRFSNLELIDNQNTVGITASVPITNRNGQKLGVAAVDISVNELSSFINEMRPTDYSRSFIVDEKMQIIADSDMQENLVLENGQATILTADKLSDDTLKVTLDQYSQKKNVNEVVSNIINIKNEKGDMVASVSQFPPALGLDWKIASVTPTSVFTAEAFAIQENSLYLGGLILLVVIIVAYFMAQNISEPISYLASEAQKIKSLNLEDIMFMDSQITEINELTNTMQESKQTLVNFSKYVPKGLIKEFVGNKREVELGGETKEVTLMFSDVENFTNMAEGLSPTDLMLHLSDYFDELTKIIIDNQGTVDKFIGDAIMAFWISPSLNQNFATDACRSVLLCQHSLKIMNEFWKVTGKPPLFTRFGLNHGNAIIGNVGSSERMNYTALGDAVNLAARLEGINKVYGTEITISESVKSKLDDKFIVRPLDIVAVKGKSEGVQIYELVGLNNDPLIMPVQDSTLEFLDEFRKAYALYCEKDWKNALKAFETLDQRNAEKNLYKDSVSALYIERCKNLIKNPPGKDWDGIFHAKEK